jgi:ParB family transcriptional regulator, chromosome partitioning protein
VSDERRPGRLGRGLSALLGEEPAPPLPAGTVAAAPGPAAGARQVPIERLHRGRVQPRRHFDPEQIEALAQSIRVQGVLQPLLVRPHPELPGEFEILAGERRWRAAQAAQLAELPVLVRDIDNRGALEIALVENIQRQDLNPIEEARGYHRLMTDFGHTQEEIARVTGKSRPHVANTVRLLNLPEEVIALVEEGKLSAGHARPLVGHENALAIAQDAVRQGMNVRQIEALAKARPAPPAGTAGAAPAPPDPNIKALEREIEELTGLKTRIADKAGEGTLTFTYIDLDQIEELLDMLRAKQ